MDRHEQASDRLQAFVGEMLGAARAFVAEESRTACHHLESRVKMLEARAADLEARLKRLADGTHSVLEAPSYWTRLQRFFQRETNAQAEK